MNYMKNIAEMLGVELNEEFVVIHDDGRSTVKLTDEGIKFVYHVGQLKEDAASICLKEILNGNFEIEHMGKFPINSDNIEDNILEEVEKWDALIKACRFKKSKEIIEIAQKGYMSLYTFGLEHMYDYLMEKNKITKHGHWKLLDNCSNAGVYCSVCGKKVYRTDYANQKVKSKYCPNCGSIMDGFEKL